LDERYDCIRDEFLRRRTQASTSTQSNLQPAPRLSLDGVEDDLVRQSSQPWDPLDRSEFFHRQSLVEDGFLGATGFLHFGHDSLPDEFPDGRDTDHDALP